MCLKFNSKKILATTTHRSHWSNWQLLILKLICPSMIKYYCSYVYSHLGVLYTHPNMHQSIEHI